MITEKDFYRQVRRNVYISGSGGVDGSWDAGKDCFELAGKMAQDFAKFCVDAKVISVDGEWHVYEQNERRFIWIRPEQLFELYQQAKQ
jgi:hypothetical protein